jgi:protein SDA1
MELQVIGDRAVKKLAFSHIVHSIRRMNQKHKNDTSNRKLQSILFKILQVCNILQEHDQYYQV